MISVITPTIREDGLKLVETALNRQTHRDFEWLVGSPFKPEYDCVWVQDNYKCGVWSLNRIYNDLICKSKGTLIVSWQDYTFADPDALEKFWFYYKEHPEALVSAVGNKYETIYPELGKKLWQDPRERADMGTFYEVYPQDVEWNLCSCPKNLLYEIGGFDEEMDFLGYGMDGYAVNERLNEVGYKFFIDQTLKSYSLTHGRVDDWEQKNLIHGEYQDHKTKLKGEGKWPVLNYLR